MAVSIAEICARLEAYAPPALQESYDNCGLLTGNGAKPVTGVLVCLDVTEAVLDEAIQKGCNLIVAHHPLIFSGLKKITGRNYVERCVIKAIQNDLALFAIHTSIDNAWNGVSHKMAEIIGLENIKVLQPKKGLLSKLVTFVPHAHADAVRSALFAAGAGHIGNYDHCSYNILGEGTFRGGEGSNPVIGTQGTTHTEPETRIEVILPAYASTTILKALKAAHPYEEVAYDLVSLENQWERVGSGVIGTLSAPEPEEIFLKRVKDLFHTGCVRHSPLRGKPVSTVALCGGSGSFLIPDALAAGADVFITGDIKYHQFFDADGRLVLADIGHFESEQYTKHLLKDILTKNFSTFAVHLSEINTNPINYL